jgi:sulfonate transport system substrate-binding protein
MRSLKLTLAVLAATAMTGAAQSEPVKIRMAWVAPVSNWASIILEKKDLAKHLGKSYTVETVRFAGTPQMITAIANGELEISNLAYSTLPLAIQNANLDDMRVIADEFQDGVEGYHTNNFAVLNDSPIRKVEDLKGKVVATNAAGSAVDIASRAMLKKHGLEDKRDYTIVEAPFPTMRAMLAEKKVDMIPNVLPFSFNPEVKKIARPLFTSKDALGISQFIIWAARKSFIDKNRAAMVDFMEDMLRIERWYLDPKNHDEAAKIAAKITKSQPERFGWLFTKQDYYRNPDMLPNLDALQSNIDMTHQVGFIKAKLDVRKYTDLSLVQEAAKRLK